jgi:disulfide bond formation protein DsbB
MSQTESFPDDFSSRTGSAVWNFGIFTLAVIAGGGSLYLSLGLDLKACPLCFYQRSFALAAILVLAMLSVRDGVRSSAFGLVTLPLALGGLGIAGFHVYLVQTGILECPPALFGLGDGPMQSLAIFGLLSIASLGGLGQPEARKIAARSRRLPLRSCSVRARCGHPLPVPRPCRPHRQRRTIRSSNLSTCAAHRFGRNRFDRGGSDIVTAKLIELTLAA